MPGLVLRYESRPEVSESFLSFNVQSYLVQSFNQLNFVQAGSQIVRTILQSIDVVGAAVKKSHYLFTEEYYDIRTLDLELGLIPRRSRVLLFAPRCRQYFIEKECEITVALVGSKLVKAGDGIKLGRRDKKANPPNDRFYVGAVKNQHRDEIVAMSLAAANVTERWSALDKQLLNKPVSVIVHEEESYGRTGRHQVHESNYDPAFLEPAVRSLFHLDNGGVMILNATFLGTRLIADLVYLYKYLFAKVSIIKPASSSPVSQNHYVVASGFNRFRYFSFHDKTKGKHRLDTMLDVLFTKATTGILRLYSFTKDLTAASIRQLPMQPVPDLSVVPPPVLNLTAWLISINDQIGLWLYANILALTAALEDKGCGFIDGHPIFVIDHAGYRSSLGYVGRLTPLMPIDLQGSDYVQPDQVSQATAKVTETGQVVTGQVELGYDPGLGFNFKLYSLLEVFTSDLLTYELFRPMLPALGAVTGTDRISVEMIHRERTELEHAVRRWLALLYYFGDLSDILAVPAGDQRGEAIFNILVKRQWTMANIFDQSEEKVATYNINLSAVYQILVYLFSNLASDLATATSQPPESDPFRQIRPRITPLQDLRFRLSYCLGGRSKAVMCRRASTFGEFDLLNLLTTYELAQVTSAKAIVELISNRSFINRLAEHASLPVLFCGYQTEMAVPSLYFNHLPDIEFFASATNHHAPLWCSATPADEKLGSLGNFFGPATEAANPIYQRIKLGIAFPPMHPLFFERVLQRLTTLLKDLANLKISFSVILVLRDAAEYIALLEGGLRSSPVVYKDLGSVNEAYDPYNGVLYDNVILKAVRLSSLP